MSRVPGWCVGGLLVVGWVALTTQAPMAAEDKSAVVHLFNGKDLTNFYTFLIAPEKGKEPYGKNNDPEKVFTVHDGMIHITGKVFGCLTTEKEFDNYHLVVEFKWGPKTWSPREDKARDSGIMLHCTGDDGGYGGTWMESYECQMIEGGTGDFLVLSGKVKRSLTAQVEKRGETYFKPGGEELSLTAGRINWYGRDPSWKDVKNFRGSEDVEKPVGEWNTLECICAGDKITNILNGKVVNVGTKATVTKGKILLQSEGAEVFFRKMDLKRLGKE